MYQSRHSTGATWFLVLGKLERANGQYQLLQYLHMNLGRLPFIISLLYNRIMPISIISVLLKNRICIGSFPSLLTVGLTDNPSCPQLINILPRSVITAPTHPRRLPNPWGRAGVVADFLVVNKCRFAHVNFYRIYIAFTSARNESRNPSSKKSLICPVFVVTFDLLTVTWVCPKMVYPQNWRLPYSEWSPLMDNPTLWASTHCSGFGHDGQRNTKGHHPTPPWALQGNLKDNSNGKVTLLGMTST